MLLSVCRFGCRAAMTANGLALSEGRALKTGSPNIGQKLIRDEKK
jgi:hypothetical protein